MKVLQRSAHILAQSRSQWQIRSYSQSFSVSHQLQKAEEEYLGDAHLRILSSPLRRCQSTMMTLPKLMMFKMVGLKGADEKPSNLVEELQKEEHLLREKETEKTDRWFARQAKVMLSNRLKGEAEMLKHKIVTSQTEESKARFKAELAEKGKQIASAQGFQKARFLRYTVQGIESPKNRKGSAYWCVLDARAAMALLEKRSFHYEKQNIKPEEFLSIIGKTLEKDVLYTVEYLSTLKTEDGWLIRQNSEKGNTLSAIVQTKSPSSIADIDTPLFLLDQLFEEKNDFRARAIQTMQTISQDTTSDPDTFFIRKHQLTTNLCVALWRLDQWRQSVRKAREERGEYGIQT